MKINKIFVSGFMVMLLLISCGCASKIAGYKPYQVKNGFVRLWHKRQKFGTKIRSSRMEKQGDHYILTIDSSWLWKKSTTKFKIREVGENIYIEPLKDE